MKVHHDKGAKKGADEAGEGTTKERERERGVFFLSLFRKK